MTLEIKILGAGCSKCKLLKRHTEKAVALLQREAPNTTATVQAVTDLEAILEYDMLTSPVLLINEQVMAAGKVLSTEEMLVLLRSALTNT